ncbi:uncharacterized protein M6B38_357890 [Iris pallida]|uniref:Uncharacterized protein n=1 Tax=Iris pallida TaxID=29817 RepID=A0AAX6GM64_IRIPA|nr:uncharacterized protein M6B38_357890 [Iris pallida]
MRYFMIKIHSQLGLEKEKHYCCMIENEWLDDNMDIDPQDTVVNVRRPEKRKKIPNVPSQQVDSDKDDRTDSGRNGATLATGFYQSYEYENPGDQSHEYSGD